MLVGAFADVLEVLDQEPADGEAGLLVSTQSAASSAGPLAR
jgi:hypothetical protein